MKFLFLCDERTQKNLSAMFIFGNIDFCHTKEEASKLMQKHHYNYVLVKDVDVSRRSEVTTDCLSALVFFSEKPKELSFADGIGACWIGQKSYDVLDIMQGMHDGVKFFKDQALQRSSCRF